MYYVNVEQIESRLQFIEDLIDAAERLPDGHDPIVHLAGQRIVHMAAECVTDIGSLLIDGFLMRDASSYEDIVQIMRDEKVAEDELFPYLYSLVSLRKPLVQQYDRINNEEVQRHARALPEQLEKFAAGVRDFIKRELV